MDLLEWAHKWNIPLDALRDLAAGEVVQLDPVKDGTSEAAVQARVRLEASRNGRVLWRNNVGALIDDRGVPVRYGLANESKAMNQRIKSADLIGITPVTIEPKHVGAVLGQFTSFEVKKAGWAYTGQGREPAQLKWMALVQQYGGIANFVTGK